jgi:hypothetical protein
MAKALGGDAPEVYQRKGSSNLLTRLFQMNGTTLRSFCFFGIAAVADETPRERFLRNHEDNVNRMKVACVTQRRLGNHEKADAMQAIIDMWTGIASDIEDAECDDNSGEEWKT